MTPLHNFLFSLEDICLSLNSVNMKRFLRLRVLCVLVLRAWIQSFPVRTECNLHILQVFVKKIIFNDGIWVSSNALTMGNNCQVNNMREFEFEFNYSVRECGIETKVYATKVIFHTIVHYDPECFLLLQDYHSKTDFHVSCVVSRIVQPEYSLWPPGQDPQDSASLSSLLSPDPKICVSPGTSSEPQEI
ncbi:oocyte-secreted protein 2 [Sminthopsis crassicaudata]|uniref:oocyte-secreted protein 2 n=1 Tax=Sminthopsis crassicaudata TaxID=9301 RepID=UPI003D68DA24